MLFFAIAYGRDSTKIMIYYCNMMTEIDMINGINMRYLINSLEHKYITGIRANFLGSQNYFRRFP
jgi:hypothetical protein